MINQLLLLVLLLLALVVVAYIEYIVRRRPEFHALDDLVMAAHPLTATLNTGYLVHPQLAVRAVMPLFANLRFNDTERLFSRPPLRLDLCHAG